MIRGVKDQSVDEHFTVVDSSGNLITGIDTTNGFTVYVYNPSGTDVSGSVSGSFTEIGNGVYKYTFTPDENGIWFLLVINSTYFPWGKTDDVYVNESDLSTVYEIVRKTLGLVHENIYIDNATYDDYGNMISARLRIYSDAASVGTSSNVIATYLIESSSEACGQFTYWKQVVI